MSDDLTQAQKDIIAQEKLMAAYRDMFGGDPASRTPNQQLVMADLEVAGYFKRPTHVPIPAFVGDRIGAVCPVRSSIAEGRRSLFLYILSNIEFSQKLQQPNQ